MKILHLLATLFSKKLKAFGGFTPQIPTPGALGGAPAIFKLEVDNIFAPMHVWYRMHLDLGTYVVCSVCKMKKTLTTGVIP